MSPPHCARPTPTAALPARWWALVGVLLVAGCSSSAPPTVTVSVGLQQEVLAPIQYCLGGEPRFYPDAERPPVLRVGPDLPITIEVSDELAESGWQVQIFDEDLAEQIGQVPVGAETGYDRINTSDAEPAAYFLVIVQDAGTDCAGLSGAWPIGFVRSD